jgi:formylglycine-generating enzyme
VLGIALVVASCGPSQDAAHGKSGKCPPGMTRIAHATKPALPYCIDRFEASLVDVTPDGERPFSPYQPIKGHRVRAVSQAGAVPQGYISQIEALAACRAADKRLCTEEEWVTACRGSKKTQFPYGDVRQSGACNDEGKSPLVRLYASAGVHAFDEDPMNDPRLNQQPNTLAPAGAYQRCTNDDATFDMVGNLHEWVDDPAGTFRGGYYLDTRMNGDGCSYRTTAHDVAYRDYSIGFRCCADEPGRGGARAQYR